jgi:hypothetical protein
MRYSNTELFKVSKDTWNKWLDDSCTPRQFFKFCESRLKDLVDESTHQDDWMDEDIKHLRNYRIKSMKFYQEKQC